ncbi:DUF7288 family protein [Haloarchaeobius litoreus]|uniref:Flagellin N-terminal-like domain-containing protein n=1 Tax=Haloarchaeobius litoreus TaxID=755306 RepID=A0ABD6DII7_9EURY|nr:hypothetical protein [Haloarchaeobius litoreus]
MNDDRSQAYTLEGFIGSILLLTAILFAFQSVVILPTTSGSVSLDIQEQLRTSANDIMIISADDGDLSCQVRYWNESSEPYFAEGQSRDRGYGVDPPPNVSSCDADGTQFGAMLNETFGEQEQEYSIFVSYRNGTDTEQVAMVSRGSENAPAVSTTYTVTLYDDQRILGDCASTCPTLHEAYNTTGFPIPEANEFEDSPIYNVVVIRVIIW